MKKIFEFLLSRREGRFLVIGTILMLTGFIVNTANHSIANLFFYGAMFFLGYFAAKEAVVETIKEKSPNVDLLMVTAALGAALIDYASEGALLLFIFALSGLMEDYANGRSTASIEELMGQVPDTAQLLLASGEVREVPTEDLKVGDRVVVSRGDQIPIDGEIDRPSQINEAALTGESVPVNKSAGAEVFAGTINDGNAFELTVTTPPEETVFSNIIRMVEEAQNRPSRVATFIDKIESKYVIGVLIAVPIFIALLYYGQGLPFEEAFYRGMVFLTVASPCALVASATPATLSAISNGASNGILTKGGAALEALSDMGVLYTDKTGTLTYGNFSVMEYEIDDDLLKEVVHMESNSAHPIAEALVNHFNDLDLTTVDRQSQVEEVAGVGLRKGDIQVGKPSAFQDYEDPHSYLEKADSNHTVIFVTEGREIKGYFTLADQIRPSAKYAVDNFQKDGVDVQILTGDSESVTREVAETLGIKEYHAALMPQEKTVFVEKAQEESDEIMVGMIGDGINDAPALATADIGVAMGEGSSVAMESADLVIVQNDLGKLYYNYRLSQRLSHIIKQNVIFAVGVMAILIILNFFGLISLPFAVLCHEGSTILVILNGLRLLRKEEDSINDDGQGQKIGQTSHA